MNMKAATHFVPEAASMAEASGLAAQSTVHFPRGLPGFEACRGFVLMAPEQAGPLQMLKSVEGPQADFLVIDPRRVLPTYRCELTDADRMQLAVGDDTVLLWLALVTIETDGAITVNLRAPVVVNPQRMIGKQVIPYDSVYPLRHVLAEGE
jgi:flagellar assembly factor FliW